MNNNTFRGGVSVRNTVAAGATVKIEPIPN